MKTILVLTMLSISLIAGAENTNDKKAVDKFIKGKITIKTTLLDKKVIKRFFEGNMYQSKISHNFGNDSSSNRGPVLHVLKDDVIAIQKPSTSQDLKSLQKALKDGVSLSKEIDILYFEKCLDVIYPISTTFGGKNAALKEFFVKGNQVIFIRGKFFETLRAIIVDLDNNKKIKSIKYTLTFKK